MIALLKQAPADVAAAYKGPGLTLGELCDQLVALGLAQRRAVGKATHLLPTRHWLRPYAGAAALPPPPQPLVPAQPPRAPPNLSALFASACKAAGSSAVEVALRPPASLGKSRLSRAKAVQLLGQAVDRAVPGAGARCCCLAR